MSVIRWEPFGDVDTVIRRLMQNSIANGTRLAIGDTDRKLDWSPPADISETDKEFVIRAELPAVKKEDVRVVYDGGMITIRGERKHERDVKGEKFHRVETVYGNFERSFSLPDNVNADAIRCETKDGMLNVRIPKIERVMKSARQITVQ